MLDSDTGASDYKGAPPLFRKGFGETKEFSGFPRKISIYHKAYKERIVMEELTGIQLPDYLVIIAYFALIVFAGYYFSKYIKMAKDFFAAGNVMPWWLAGTSYFMASFSTLLFVIYNQIAYDYGFVAVTVCWFSPVAVLLGGYFLAQVWPA